MIKCVIGMYRAWISFVFAENKARSTTMTTAKAKLLDRDSNSYYSTITSLHSFSIFLLQFSDAGDQILFCRPKDKVLALGIRKSHCTKIKQNKKRITKHHKDCLRPENPWDNSITRPGASAEFLEKWLLLQRQTVIRTWKGPP